MKVIGLTGGIASGKSTISKMLMELDIPIIDADKIAKEIVKPNSYVLKLLCKEFGSNILEENGSLNRKKLGNIVFNDKTKLKRLNEITHPVIREEIEEAIEYYTEREYNTCILDAAILIEGNFTDLVDYIILIYTEVEKQIQRLVTRDKITEGEALKRISAQMSFEEKSQFSDFILDNNMDLEYTKIQLNRILNEIISMEGIDG